MQIATAKSNYQFSIEDYEIKKQNLDLPNVSNQKMKPNFLKGSVLVLIYRQAQTQLYNAQSDYLEAMLDVITNKTELETVLNQPNN